MIRFYNFHFASAHLYHQKAWSNEKNKEIFGACFTPFGHGHNYRLHLGVDAKTNEALVHSQIKPVLALLDHHHLNFDVPEFKDVVPTVVPTTENIALFIAEKIKSSIPGLQVIRLYETPDLWAEVNFER
jgi:6-pyruvoyltetrahydropterin/6-carboxytetrahydropterin synthase